MVAEGKAITIITRKGWERAAKAETELEVVRETWRLERASYDETIRVLNERCAELLARAQKAEAEIAQAAKT